MRQVIPEELHKPGFFHKKSSIVGNKIYWIYFSNTLSFLFTSQYFKSFYCHKQVASNIFETKHPRSNLDDDTK